MQDKLTGHFLSQPHLRKYTSEMGLVSSWVYIAIVLLRVLKTIRSHQLISRHPGRIVP